MSESAELLIGAEIRKHRLQHGYTLQALGKATKLSKSYLSRVENGHASPSIPALLLIAKALGVSAGEILGVFEQNTPVRPILVKASERKRISRGRRAVGYAYEALACDSTSAMRPFIIRNSPVHRSSVVFEHQGYEFDFVVEGEVELLYAGEAYLLRKGDSVYYDSSVPHAARAMGSEESVVLAILLEEQSQGLSRREGGETIE